MSKRTLVGMVVGILGFAVSITAWAQGTGSPRKAVLRINQIKAVDECGGFIELGYDTITVGAVAVEDGVARVRALAAGKFGHDNSRRDYRPPKPFLTFKLQPGTKRSHAYLVLAERDARGGFGDFLNKFRARIQAGLPAPAAPRSGGLGASDVIRAGTSVATDGLSTSTALKLGKMAYEAVIGSRTDDIFTHSHVVFDTSDPSRLQPKTLTFTAKDCKYTLTYSWAQP